MIYLFDLGIELSMSFLFYLSMSMFILAAYIATTVKVYKYTSHCIIPKGVICFMYDVSATIFHGKISDIFVGIFLILFSVIPISICWPITYPVIIYKLFKYKKSQRFIDLCNSV